MRAARPEHGSSKKFWSIMTIVIVTIFIITRSKYALKAMRPPDALTIPLSNQDRRDFFYEELIRNSETSDSQKVIQSSESKFINAYQSSKSSQKDESKMTKTTPLSHHSNAKKSLRLDWRNLSVSSEIAKRLQIHQNNCSLPVRIYEWRIQGYGIGSDIHVWGNQLWAGLLNGFRVRSPNPWIFQPLNQSV
jgi:hypothetical protein